MISKINASGFANLAPKMEANGAYAITFADIREAGGIPLIIGDAIHNMRSALDHVWMALWRQAKKSGYGTFPFHEERANLEDMVKKSPIRTAFPQIDSLILDAIKPYRDGNHLLWTITKFDKLDKHNLIIPTLQIRRGGPVTIKAANSIIKISDIIMEDCAPVNLVAGDNPFELNQDNNFSLEIHFQNGGFLEGQPVLPSLLDMLKAVDETIQLFWKTFIAV